MSVKEVFSQYRGKLKNMEKKDKAIRDLLKDLLKRLQEVGKCKTIVIELGERNPTLYYVETRDPDMYELISEELEKLSHEVANSLGTNYQKKVMREDTHFFVGDHWICLKLVKL